MKNMKDMTEKTHYVLGFAFDQNLNVLLIEKTRPSWQQGLLNGAGGKIESHDASPVAAMVREFKEETGLHSMPEQWRRVVQMEGLDWVVHVFSIDVSDDLMELNGRGTDTDEKVRVITVDQLYDAPVISNLPWLIGMCLDEQMPVDHYTVTFP
jgi:8-oxo-dGTP diphosphatase